MLDENPTSEQARNTLQRIGELFSGYDGADVQSEVDVESEEEILGRKIDEFETSFLRYGAEVMLPLIDVVPPEKHALKMALSYPFQTVEKNRRQNPWRNATKVRRLADEQNQNWQLSLLGMQDPDFFAMDTILENHPMYNRVVAGFAPIARTMMFHPMMESSNELDKLVILHECLHIPQMSLRRSSNIELYVWLYGKEPRIVVEDDY